MRRQQENNCGRWAAILAAACLLCMGRQSPAVEPGLGAKAEASRWAAAKFGGLVSPAAELPPALVVLANNDPVQKNSRAEQPLKIGTSTYKRGLYCHAFSKIIVRLSEPAEKFSAIAGVDTNEQTSGGRGSVRFSVWVGGAAKFQSDVLHEGSAAVPIDIKLDGAREFVLQVDDGGDGIGCDQADWADAKVTLPGGRDIWIADLPFDNSVRVPLTTQPPFTFKYGGKDFAELPWKVKRSSRELDTARTEHTLLYTEEASGLTARCLAVEYHDFPTVEWTLYLKNTGSSDTQILSDIQAVDAILGGGDKVVLHHNVGSPCQPNDFEPLETPLKAGQSKRISAAGGRPSNSDWPYFNLAWAGGGVIAAVGWPGQWAADFSSEAASGVRFRAGQELTHLKLHPGEEIRTPLIALQFWEGEWIDAQNVWRRWMLAHNLPRPGGKLPGVQMAACSSHQFGEMIHADSANQKFFVDRYLEEKLPLKYWWMDAGWYPCDGQWPKTGTWEVDTRRFPGGLRSIADHARAKGVKTIVWFEPERVHSGTWLAENHPEWVLGGRGGGLLNLGDDAARKWLTDHIDQLITEQGIDLYRQDFNLDPLSHWRANDKEDRQGITENHHVAGYLTYWDELRRRHPDMLIDSCASGGRRNDLETMRRSVPLLRSDYIMEPVGNQAHTYGLSLWLPFQGTGTGSGPITPYLLRSTLVTHFTACFDMRKKDLDYALIRRVLEQWCAYAPYYFADYYPLTPYSLDRSVWMAWQFHSPEKNEGMVQAFRRADSIYEVARFKLRGVEAGGRYTLTDIDSGQTRTVTGEELLSKGLSVSITDQPGSAVITYKKASAE